MQWQSEKDQKKSLRKVNPRSFILLWRLWFGCGGILKLEYWVLVFFLFVVVDSRLFFHDEREKKGREKIIRF